MDLRPLAILPLLGLAATAHALDADVSFNQDAVRGSLAVTFNQNIQVDGSWVHHKDEGDAGGFGAHLVGNPAFGDRTSRAGLGARFLLIDADQTSDPSNDDGFVLPIGGFFNYTFPNFDRVSVGTQLYYAPGVLAFSDVDNYFEAGIWASYALIPDGDVYVGARNIRAEMEDGTDAHMDTGLHVGVRLSFK